VRIKHVMIVFENGLCATILPSAIMCMNFLDVRDNIRISGSDISKSRTAGISIIYLTELAKETTVYSPEEYEEKDDIFTRILKFPDVAQIHITYEDDSSEWFFTLWEAKDDYEYNNKLQSSSVDSDGILRIAIHE
jgi:hypothetical protein